MANIWDDHYPALQVMIGKVKYLCLVHRKHPDQAHL